jgi:hypothetical protein
MSPRTAPPTSAGTVRPPVEVRNSSELGKVTPKRARINGNSGGLNLGGPEPYIRCMSLKPIELPPVVARDFVRDMKAFS